MGNGFSKSSDSVAQKRNGSILYVIVILMGVWVAVISSLLSGIFWYKSTLQLGIKDRQSLSIALSAVALLKEDPSQASFFPRAITKSWLKQNHLLLHEIEIVQNQKLYLAKTPTDFYVFAAVDVAYTTALRLSYTISTDTTTQVQTVTITKIEML